MYRDSDYGLPNLILLQRNEFAKKNGEHNKRLSLARSQS